MKIFARTVTCSWTSGMVTRYARSASMTHAKERSTGVYAVGGKRPPCIGSCKYSPVFRRIEAFHHQALASGRRFQ
jgi:hypothetical protein